LSALPNDFASRREFLAAQIARQRVELAQAYRQLEKPFHYAEYGVKGFSFIRNNPWIVAVAPAVFGLVLKGFGKKKSPAPKPEQRQSISSEPKGIKEHAVVWSGRAWQLYQLYRRVRHLLP